MWEFGCVGESFVWDFVYIIFIFGKMDVVIVFLVRIMV